MCHGLHGLRGDRGTSEAGYEFSFSFQAYHGLYTTLANDLLK
jgi:hypothetical protein